MLITFDNSAGLKTYNALETGGNGVSTDAVGGNRTNPLPYPFEHRSVAAGAAAFSEPVNVRDLILGRSMHRSLRPADEWNQIINSDPNLVVSFVAQDNSGAPTLSVSRDSEYEAINVTAI